MTMVQISKRLLPIPQGPCSQRELPDNTALNSCNNTCMAKQSHTQYNVIVDGSLNINKYLPILLLGKIDFKMIDSYHRIDLRVSCCMLDELEVKRKS